MPDNGYGGLGVDDGTVDPQRRQGYEKLGVPNNFRIHTFDGEHEINGEESYDFLKTHLSRLG